MAKLWRDIKDYPDKTGCYLGFFSSYKPKEYYVDIIIFFDGFTYDEAHGILPEDKDLEYGPGFYTWSVDEWNDKWVFCEYNNAFVGWMPFPEIPKEDSINV